MVFWELKMSRKDYIKAAKMVKNLRGSISENLVVEDFLVQLFKEDNKRFNEDKFRKTCKNFNEE